jgi:hypothetical protein
MATKYKSVLEKYPPHGSEAWKRLKEKEQAIEPDTTLESLLVAPARAGASVLKNIASKPKPRTIETPEIGSGIVPESVWKNVGWSKTAPTEKTVSTAAMDNALVNSAERATKNLAGEAGYHTGALRNEYEERKAEKDKDLQLRVYKSQTEDPSAKLKKGGKVTASSRADGCAIRGKTRA